MKTDFEGGEGNAENNILNQLKRRLNIILFGTTKPEEDQKIKLEKMICSVRQMSFSLMSY